MTPRATSTALLLGLLLAVLSAYGMAVTNDTDALALCQRDHTALTCMNALTP